MHNAHQFPGHRWDVVLPCVAAVRASTADEQLLTGAPRIRTENPMSQSTSTATDAQGKKNAAVPLKTWQYFGAFSSPQEAADFANLEPAQGAGEAEFSVREDGMTTDTFLFL